MIWVCASFEIGITQGPVSICSTISWREHVHFFFHGKHWYHIHDCCFGKAWILSVPKTGSKMRGQSPNPLFFFHRPVKKFGYPQQHQSYPRGKTSNLWSFGTVASCIRSLRSWTTLILGHFWNENLQAEVEAEALKPEGDNGTDKAWGWVGLEDPDPLTGFPSLGYRQKKYGPVIFSEYLRD